MFVQFDWLGAMTDSPILMILLVLSVITGGVALERAVYFHRRRGHADLVWRDVREDLRRRDVSAAIARCRRSSHPMGEVAAETLESHLAQPDQTDEAMQVALSQQKLLLERSLGVLGSMAAVAPLIGLLGTVWGIMRAFHDMAATGSAAPSVVAAGVAEALVTTAAGLIVAVPALLLFNHFNRRLNVMLTVAENHARSLRATLITSLESEAKPRAQTPAPSVLVSEHVEAQPEPVGAGQA
jgi:biopolymer transport protein ExbB